MRSISFILILLLPELAWANMASPYHAGSMAGTPFISQHVHIEKEKILITPDNNARAALFEVEYHINAERSGRQIPLLFYAIDLKGDFNVWLDDVPVKLQPIPADFNSLEGKSLSEFHYLFESDSINRSRLFQIPYADQIVSASDFQYFVTDLDTGKHIIRVEYTAEYWVNRIEWVNEYSLEYILSPAKFWKSFGELEIILDASDSNYKFSANLGPPEIGNLHSNARWSYASLPLDKLTITIHPKISLFAKILIALSPVGIMVLFAVLIVLLHFVVMHSYRRNHLNKRFSGVMITGSILVPLIVLIIFILSYEGIDLVIGNEASRYHGYTFLYIMLYPFVMPPYWIIMWLIDRYLKHRISRNL